MNKQIKILQFVLILISLAIAMASCKDDEEPFYRVQINGLYGFVDEKGEIKIEPQYKYVSNFSEDGYALVISTIKPSFWIDNDGFKHLYEKGNEVHYGIIDRNNQLVIDTTLVIYEHLSNSIFSQFNQNKLSFNDVILSEYEPSDGLFKVNDGYKSIKSGRLFKAFKFDKNGKRLFRRNSNGNLDILDLKGTVIGSYMYGSDGYIENSDHKTNPLYYNRSLFSEKPFNNGFMWVRASINRIHFLSNRKFNYYLDDRDAVIDAPISAWFLIDTDGICHEKLICEGKYGLLYEGDDLSILVNCQDSICELMSLAEMTGIRFKLNDGHYLPLSEGYFGLLKSWNGQYGWAFVSSDLSHRSPAVYEDIKPFMTGFAAVKKDGKWGYVDHGFQMRIPFQYDDCGSFNNGRAYFCKCYNGHKQEGYIDMQGKVVWQTTRSK